LVQVAAWTPDNQPLPPGAENAGELVLQCPWLTQGYYRNEETSQALWRGGWLHTGDIAYMDHDGYIRITDRLKDVVKIGGEWISSLELENALSQHPAVREVAVFGVPDTKWDEHPHAEVVLHEAHRGEVTPRELAKHLHGFIDRGLIHKRAILTEIALVEAIPKTSVGKIDKKLMRARFKK
jgi:fatty-acyl-CoA synthase